MENMESGHRNGNGTGTRTGTRTRLIEIEDVLMVLLTIITCSNKMGHFRSIYITMLPPFAPFHSEGNGT